MNWKVFPVHDTWLIAVGEIESSGGGVGSGATGRVSEPGLFVSLAVVCLPDASTIVNVSGSTHTPVVIASKKPPLAATVGFTRVAPVGNEDETR